MQRLIAASVTAAFAVAVSGCMSTHANPVPISQIGDDKLSCNSIIAEMQTMQQLAEQRSADATNQTAKNAALAVTGVFLIVPLFFIDPHNKNSVEEEAARNRYLKLQTMGKDKGCF